MSNIDTSSSERVPLILVVDDDRTMRSLLNLAMEEEGYRVAEAKNGEQGLAEYTRLQPDMVLLDAVMPDMDGFECCQKIRQLVGGDLVPILMITVLDERESIEQAFAVGATDYITKPLHWEVLSHRVARMLAAYRAMLETEQVKKQLQNKLVWEQLLRTILQKLWHSSEFRTCLPAILTEIQNFLEVEKIVLFQKENKRFVELTSSDSSDEEIKILVDNLNVDSEYALQEQAERAIAIDSLTQAELSPATVAKLAELKINALLIAPIIVRDRFWGLLYARHSHNFRQWKKSEIEQFSDIAKLLTIAIRNNQTESLPTT